MKSFYGSRWRKERLAHLAREPWCRFCAQLGKRIPAVIVDHTVPHRGNAALFWSRSNWQSLCKSCHDGVKQRLEKSGSLRGGDAQGYPLDTSHHWNQP